MILSTAYAKAISIHIIIIYRKRKKLTIETDTDTNTKFAGNFKESQTQWNSQKEISSQIIYK